MAYCIVLTVTRTKFWESLNTAVITQGHSGLIRLKANFHNHMEPANSSRHVVLFLPLIIEAKSNRVVYLLFDLQLSTFW